MSPARVKLGYLGRMVGTWENPIAPAQLEGDPTSGKNLLWHYVTPYDTTGIIVSFVLLSGLQPHRLCKGNGTRRSFAWWNYQSVYPTCARKLGNKMD